MECFWGPLFVAIRDYLKEFLRCGNVKLRCMRFGETAWHVSSDLGLRCETAIRIAAIYDARCETAKLISIFIVIVDNAVVAIHGGCSSHTVS